MGNPHPLRIVPLNKSRRKQMSNKRRKSIGQRKLREALERRLERGKRKLAAKQARINAKEQTR